MKSQQPLVSVLEAAAVSDTALNDYRMRVARNAVDFMAQHRLSPTTNNFRVWSAYFEGANRKLCDAVDEQKRKGAPIDAALSEALYELFFTLKRTDDDALAAGDDAEASLEHLKQCLKEGIAARREYANVLERRGKDLETADDSRAMIKAVADLIDANKAIERRSAKLESAVLQTAGEMDRLKREFDQLRSETLTDGLTGLANRKHFDETLKAALSQAREGGEPLSLIMCDIDHFKAFNDTWGHQTGDQVIRFVASVMSDEAKDGYTVARYGGEEFAVIIPKAPLGEARSYAERVRERVGAKILTRRSTRESMGRVTVSLGVAALKPREERESLIRRADENLYRSKRAGRNKVTYEGLG
jgi:diguanylate cyclase